MNKGKITETILSKNSVNCAAYQPGFTCVLVAFFCLRDCARARIGSVMFFKKWVNIASLVFVQCLVTARGRLSGQPGDNEAAMPHRQLIG